LNERKAKLNSYDVIIIGKGPAGISAALYTGRANLKTLVIGTEESSLNKSSSIENYYGFAEPISGKALLDAGIKQAIRLGIEVVTAEVLSLAYDGGFTVKSVEKEYKSRALLLSSGQPHQTVKILGFSDFEGKGVSYCTTCDGFFYKNLTVGVLGYGNYAIEEAQALETFTKDITIFTNGRELELSQEFLEKASHFKIEKRPVKQLLGDTVLREIVFEDGQVPLRGLFVAYGAASSVDFAVKIGLEVSNNSIVVGVNQQTNLEGVFAAGDCTGGFKQVSTAVGQGAIAGKSIINFIKSK
jgi:thioredoxin reductase (NADPH)